MRSPSSRLAAGARSRRAAMTAGGLCAALCLALFGCTRSPAPRAWLASPAAAESTAYGGWVVVELGKPRQKEALSGELIAIDEDSLFVLSGSTLVAVKMGETKQVTLWGYDSRWGSVALWTIVGALSTASHGWALAATFPLLWVLPGTLITGSASRNAVVTVPKRPWTALQPFSRFPQGLPSNLNRDSLLPNSAKAAEDR